MNATNTKMTPAQKVKMKEFSQRYFDFMEKYWNPSESDEYWDQITDDAMELIENFHSTEESLNDLVQNVVMAFLNSRESILS